jgi:chemotaxis protein histidine kinase CheA
MSMIENNFEQPEGFVPPVEQKLRRVIRPEWLARFRQAAEAHLAEIEQGLDLLPAQLGQATGKDEAEKEQQALRELFRQAHTLKGSARMVEQEQIAEEAAALEHTLGEAYLDPTGFGQPERASLRQKLNQLLALVKAVVAEY